MRWPLYRRGGLITQLRDGLSRIVYVQSTFGWLAGCHYLRAILTHAPVSLEVQPAGVAHPFRLRCRTSDLPTFDQVFGGADYDFDVGSKPAVIVDAGANIGLASIVFANRFPGARIVAIEPDAENFALLCKNVQHYAQVTPIRAALWGRTTALDVTDQPGGHWAFTVAEPKGIEATDRRGEVPGITVDRLMTDLRLDRLSILKIDIEGAELELFRDSSGWISRVDSIIIELHDRMRPGCSRSFYNGSNGFDTEWMQGENVYLSRGNTLVPGAVAGGS